MKVKWVSVLLISVTVAGCKDSPSSPGAQQISVNEILGWWKLDSNNPGDQGEIWAGIIKDDDAESPGGQLIYATSDMGCVDWGITWSLEESTATSVTISFAPQAESWRLEKEADGRLLGIANTGERFYLLKAVNPCFGAEDQPGLMSVDDILGWWGPLDGAWADVGSYLGFLPVPEDTASLPRGSWSLVWPGYMADCTDPATPGRSWQLANATNGTLTISFDDWQGIWLFERRSIDGRLKLSCATIDCPNIQGYIYLDEASDPCQVQ